MPKFRIEMECSINATVEGSDKNVVAATLATRVGDVLVSMGASDEDGAVLMTGTVHEVKESKAVSDATGTPYSN